MLTEMKKLNACVVAPAYGVRYQNQLSSSIENAFNVIELYNFTPQIHKDTIVPNAHPLFDPIELPFANTDELRLKFLMDALNDDNCDIIWCFRGGYGSIRILGELSQIPTPLKIKPFIGFSDITILHLFMNFYWQWPTIHFGMPGALEDSMRLASNIESLNSILHTPSSNTLYSLIPLNEQNFSMIEGILCGGNKVLFERFMTTEFLINLSNKIIVLEDVGEKPRWLDGFLEELSLREDFNNISAIIFGEFLPQEPLLKKIIIDFSNKVPIPIFEFSPDNTIGHGKINNALLLGVNSTIKPDILKENYYLEVNTYDFFDATLNHNHEGHDEL